MTNTLAQSLLERLKTLSSHVALVKKIGQNVVIFCVWQNSIYPMFGKIIPPIPFHSILFQTIQLFNLTNYSIPFHFFSIIFFNFPNSYIMSVNLNHLYHFEIHKVKLFNIIFLQIISNHFQTIFSIPKNEIE